MELLRKIFGKKTIENNEKAKTETVDKTATVTSPKLFLEDLNEKEKEFIKNGIELAKVLLEELELTNEVHPFSPEIIDTVIGYWFEDGFQEYIGVNLNNYSVAFASAWGQFLVDTLGMEWRVITDNSYTEVGVYHKNHEVVIFPFAVLLKKLNSKSASKAISIMSDFAQKAINLK